MHIVTYDTSRYATLGEAVTGDDSLAVLGVMFEVSDAISHITQTVWLGSTIQIQRNPHLFF